MGASTATPLPEPPPTITLAAVEAPPTAVPLSANTPLPAAPVGETAVPPTPLPAPEEIGTETAVPVAAGEVFGPGQQDRRTVTGGGEQTYLIDGVEFMPRFIFIETADEIDLLLSVGGAEANFSGPGGAEVLVYTADENGRADLIVSNQSETGGEYTLYLFDAAQSVPGAVHQPNVALAADEIAQYQVESRNGRPVLIFVDPTDQSDISVTVTASDGQVVAEANYSGPGSAEAVFVLPRQTTRYTVAIREINNAPAQINVLLIPLE